MKNITLSQNWMTIVGCHFQGIADCVEILIEPNKKHKLSEKLKYTEAKWHEEYPDAKKYIECDGKWHGDYKARNNIYTMKESVDKIIAYVYFGRNNHEFSGIKCECGSVSNRKEITLSMYMTPLEIAEVVGYARQHLKSDLTKAHKDSHWMYANDVKPDEDIAVKW